MEIRLPYGKEELAIELPRERIKGILSTSLGEQSPPGGECELIERALASPVAGPPLSEMARGRKEVVIITSDHTRPLPSKVTLPPTLKAVRRGNPHAEITILMATGYHRAPTREELEDKLGQEITGEERILIHSAREKEQMEVVGRLPSGQELAINRAALKADLLLAEGFIEPHLFAGFSGGAKSILPGIAGQESIFGNHCAEFIAHPRARTGILTGNPIQEDIRATARLAGLDFILNVALNSTHQVIGAFAGEPEAAHNKGCEYVESLTRVKSPRAEIVITTNGGYPLDQNIYQGVKGMTAAEAACQKGGTIIAISRCSDGHGSDDFYQEMTGMASPEKIWEEINKRSRKETRPDQWQAQILARILSRFRVIMVTGAPRNMVENMHLEWAPSVGEALKMIDSGGKITVIPDGVGVIVDADS